MEYNYKIDTTILNILSRFYELHGALYASLHLLPGDIQKELNEVTSELAAFGAVIKNTNLMREVAMSLDTSLIKNLLPAESRSYYKLYLNQLHEYTSFDPEEHTFTVDSVIAMHNEVLGVKDGAHLRTAKKRLSASYVEDGITYSVRSEVKTPPEEILPKLESFITWLNEHFDSQNPIVLAAITYFNIAAIHPFQRANGRMSKLLSRRVLYAHGVDPQLMLAIDDYFLNHQHYYYKVIEKCIETGDITDWIEFYSKAMLYAVMQTAELLCKLSGGAIDIRRQRYVALTPREMRALRIIMNENNISGAAVARKLHTTRQNVHEILKSLIDKELITKTGQNTGTRYSFVS
ncbi:MAG: Fic/DOC family protein [candidate division WS6 bacterium OLB20]|uniref:Fic/DOC family protein n=1 Tax=candidate division WS6 bacterium OLB20 TaxID=1617426 RepID=A0A136M0X4_9BACT|nr:MAG: Fic/DOC family protein [candidate division WS6 bacterium OLB20]